MGFPQRQSTHARWLTTPVAETPELYGLQPPASGDVQFAHARQRRNTAACVAALCFTALVVPPELRASAPAPGPTEAAQAQSRTLTQYQQSAGPVFVPAVVVVPALTPPVYPHRLDRRVSRAAFFQHVAWHPDTPVVVVPPVAPDGAASVIEAAQAQARRVTQYQSSAGPVFVPGFFDVIWTGPANGHHNFVDGPLRFTTPGSYTLTFTITAQLRITGIGGGGGGKAGGLDSTQSTGGSGGGSGASDATGVVIATTPAETFTVVVGAHGNGGSSAGAVGTAGGNTSYTGSVQGTVLLMGGGGGGTASGGTAGAATTGSTSKQAGRVGGAGAVELTVSGAGLGTAGPTGGGGGGGAGPSGSGGMNTGAAGGAGSSEAGGLGATRGNDGQSTAAADGGQGTGVNVYGGGGAGGGLLLPGGDLARGGGGGGGGGANSGGVTGGGGDGSDGILVLAVAVPDGRPPTDTGSLYPDRAWQYQQVAAPVLVDLPVVVPPSGTFTGGSGVTDAAQAQARALTQYQASAGPVFVRKPGPADWTPTAPSWFPRKRGLTAGQQQAYAGPLVVPDVTVATPPFPQTVYPNRLERRQRASELVTRTPVYVPDMTDITPEMTPPVYPSRLQRLAPLPQHLAAAQPVLVIEPETVPTFFGAVFPNRIDARQRPQHQAFAWAPQTPEDYPVGSATALYPRWFPLRASRAAYFQALGWSTVTPPDVVPGEFFFTSVFPRRLDRAPRILEGYTVAPVYVPDVTAPPPTLQPPPVYPQRLDRRVIRPGTIPSRAVLPILPPTELPTPPVVCVTAPPTAGCWPPDDETPPSVKPIGRLGRQRP